MMIDCNVPPPAKPKVKAEWRSECIPDESLRVVRPRESCTQWWHAAATLTGPVIA
jgi:hypothetical protein